MLEGKWQAIKNWQKIGIVILICIIIGGMYFYKNMGTAKNTGLVNSSVQSDTKLPRLVELGAKTCIPCKEMAPILADLQREYAGRIMIEVIDVNENREVARTYQIRVIPTQILFDAEGKEVGRHEGFMLKEALVKAFEKVGVK
jgi:thioredoxin 1